MYKRFWEKVMANNFESSAKRFLNSPNIFWFEKDMWELTKKNRSSNSHDPKYKDHRRGMYDFRAKVKVKP